MNNILNRVSQQSADVLQRARQKKVDWPGLGATSQEKIQPISTEISFDQAFASLENFLKHTSSDCINHFNSEEGENTQSGRFPGMMKTNSKHVNDIFEMIAEHMHTTTNHCKKYYASKEGQNNRTSQDDLHCRRYHQ